MIHEQRIEIAGFYLRIVAVIIFSLVCTKVIGQQVVLQDDYTDRSKFIDLSELLFWNNEQDTITAFEFKHIKDGNNLEYRALSLKPEALGQGGYNAGSSYASTCIDYRLPLYNRRFDTLIIEFDYLSASLSGSGEGGRLGIATMYQYPPGGPKFNDVYNQKKSHPFGRPAYNLRILNKADNGNGAYLFYGGGDDELGEFEQTGDGIWLPGFISGPGGFSPGQKKNYPEAPVLETTNTMVSSQYWHHYTWKITPRHLLVYTRESNEPDSKNELQMDMLLPEGGETEVVQQLNDFYQTNVNQLPANYHYFAKIEALRFYFRSIDNGYLANIKVSKTNHFEPATITLMQDTLFWPWDNQNKIDIPLSVKNPQGVNASFQLYVTGNSSMLKSTEFTFSIKEIDQQLSLPLNEDYSFEDDQDTLYFQFAPVSGWLDLLSNRLIVVVEDGRVTAINDDLTKPVLYPNPFYNQLNVSLSYPVRIEIFNTQHQLITVQQMNESINLAHLPAGLYFIKLYTHEQVQLYKVIKK